MKNRKMKTVLLAVAVVLIAGIMLSGCGGSSYAGTWKATDVKNPAQIHMDPSVTGSSLEFELASDGKGTMTLNGASVDITWTETDSGVKLDQEGGHTLDLTTEEGKLTMVDGNGNTIYFEKQ